MLTSNGALLKARRRLVEVNRILLNRPSPRTRPKWEKVRAALKAEIASLEKLDRNRKR